MKTDNIINTITGEPLNQSLVQLEEMKVQNELQTRQHGIYSRPSELGLLDSEVTLISIMNALPSNSTCYLDFYEEAGPYQYPEIQAMAKFRSGTFKFEKGLLRNKGLVTYSSDAFSATAGYNEYYSSHGLSFFSGTGAYSFSVTHFRDPDEQARITNIYIFGVEHALSTNQIAQFVDLPTDIDPDRIALVTAQAQGAYMSARKVFTMHQIDTAGKLRQWVRMVSDVSPIRDTGWVRTVTV